VALVLGIIAVRRANRGEAGGKGMAIGGIVTGAISIVFGIFIGIFIFTFGLGVVEEMEACLEETGGDQQECQDRLEREITDRFLGD
jgi:Na+/H+-dicarboxylate symporter